MSLTEPLTDVNLVPAATQRRSSESHIDIRPGSAHSNGYHWAHQDDHQAIMRRRKKAYEALFAGETGNDNHFMNEELAARSSLFNAGS